MKLTGKVWKHKAFYKLTGKPRLSAAKGGEVNGTQTDRQSGGKCHPWAFQPGSELSTMLESEEACIGRVGRRHGEVYALTLFSTFLGQTEIIRLNSLATFNNIMVIALLYVLVHTQP